MSLMEQGVDVAARLDELLDRLERLETTLSTLVQQRMVKDWYTTAEAATILDRAEFTVREWCRLGRVSAAKRPCGRDNSQESKHGTAEGGSTQNQRMPSVAPMPQN